MLHEFPLFHAPGAIWLETGWWHENGCSFVVLGGAGLALLQQWVDTLVGAHDVVQFQGSTYDSFRNMAGWKINWCMHIDVLFRLCAAAACSV